MGNDTSCIYGRHPVTEAIRSGQTIDKVLLQQGTRGEFEKEIRHLCKAAGIPMQVVPREKLSQIVSGNHQGVIALVSLGTYYALEDLLPNIFERSQTPLLLLLDGVTDVRNFGAIARTAECMGAQALVVPQKGSALINADAMKASAGALSKIPVCRERSLSKAVELLQQSGVRVYASDLQAEQCVFELDFRHPTAFLLGSEGAGVSPALLRQADARFIIPQSGETDSLNVSVAAGMMLYEATRQRLTKQ